MIYILSWTTKKHLKKKLSRPLHSKLKKIQGLPLKFKDFQDRANPVTGLSNKKLVALFIDLTCVVREQLDPVFVSKMSIKVRKTSK